MIRENNPLDFAERDARSSWTLKDWIEVATVRNFEDPLPFPAGRVLNLGCGNKIIGPDSTGYDITTGWDAETERIPELDSSIAGIHAYHFLEHIENPIEVLSECQRVLFPGGILNIVVPHGLADQWAEDITHKKRFAEGTWAHLFDNYYFSPTNIEWKLKVHTNFIFGHVWRNLMLFTQLVKTG